MSMIFTGRFSDFDGHYDYVECTICGHGGTAPQGTDPHKLTCNNTKCKGEPQ